jgi:TIR domain/GUN4-like
VITPVTYRAGQNATSLPGAAPGGRGVLIRGVSSAADLADLREQSASHASSCEFGRPWFRQPGTGCAEILFNVALQSSDGQGGLVDHRLHAGDSTARSFFISYAHENIDYTRRLATHLRQFELPTWYDADLNWGERFPQKISEQIMHATGVIVVMSPAAAESEWVEREILEGQRYNRVFLPVLIAGDRLFLLAATNYFDARLGRLPGDRELRWLRQLADCAEPGRRSAPLQDWGQVAQGSMAAGRQDTDALLAKLHLFLADGRVEHADILTTSMLVGAAGRIGSGWLRREDGSRLLSGLLAGIDLIWSGFSGGGHGFRAQLVRHAGPPAGARPGDHRDFMALALALGWKSAAGGATPRYGEFVRPVTGEWPAGFFPTLRNPQIEQRQGWPDRWRETVIAVHLRLRDWGSA